MVPWPMALLTLFYGVIATTSAADAWRVMQGTSAHALAWPLAWLVLSGGAMCGLPLLKRWGRALAVSTSLLLTLATLAAAALLIGAGRPGAGLLVSLSTAFHAVVVRYLQRPDVKSYFGLRISDFGVPQSAICNPQ